MSGGRPDGGPAELKTIVESLTPQALGSGQPGGWDVGVTEIGDPQFYLLGPPPHDECILCISRLGRVYVLEDGAGTLLFEHNSLVVLAEQAQGGPAEKESADRRPRRARLVRGARDRRRKARASWCWKARSCWRTACRSSPHWHEPGSPAAAESGRFSFLPERPPGLVGAAA